MMLLMCIVALIPLVMTVRNLSEYQCPAMAAHRPRVSVLIPARDEENNIGPACAAILASENVDLELIVLDDGSTDGTRAVLAAMTDTRLQVASAPPLPRGWCGKQHACHILGGLAKFDLLVFVDADVRLAPDALSRMAGFMERSGAALASGVPRQILKSWSEQLILPLIHFMLMGYLPMALMRLRKDPRFGAGCGQLFVADRVVYASVGGHAQIASSIHDGLALPRLFRRCGYQTLLFDATRLAHCRMYKSASEVWNGLGKNATEAMARPIALPIWTVILFGGQVLPIIVFGSTHAALAAAALASGIVTRLILAFKFRQPVISAFFHPIGVGALLLIQWYSLIKASAGGSVSWRGRRYG